MDIIPTVFIILLSLLIFGSARLFYKFLKRRNVRSPFVAIWLNIFFFAYAGLIALMLVTLENTFIRVGGFYLYDLFLIYGMVFSVFPGAVMYLTAGYYIAKWVAKKMLLPN